MSSSSGSDDTDNYKITSHHSLLKEIILKVLIIGDYGVGKTAIVKRYVEGKFSSNYKITIGADFAIKSLQWDPHTQVNIQLWDIAGHERFGCMTRVYYKYAVAAAVVFDVSRIATFQSLQKWLSDVRDKVVLTDGSPIPVIIMANKSDITGAAVPADALDKFCRDNDVSKWYDTSAKENQNIDEAMGFLIARAMENKLKETSPLIRDSISLQSAAYQMTSKENNCCS